MVNLKVMSSGVGTCALTGKAETDGLTVGFENEAPTFVSWKAFRQLLSYRTAQTVKPEPKPAVAIPANGPVPVK